MFAFFWLNELAEVYVWWWVGAGLLLGWLLLGYLGPLVLLLLGYDSSPVEPKRKVCDCEPGTCRNR